MTPGKLFVISGPSGVGKGTLVERLRSRLPQCVLSVSATTRKPRPGEVDGVSYHFLSDEEFDRLISEDGLLEWAEFSGHRYGHDVLLEIDVQGAMQVRTAAPDALLIFIAPPSRAELERRLRERGTESAEAIERRLAAAEVELSRQNAYDRVFVNDDLERTTDELVAFMSARDER